MTSQKNALTERQEFRARQQRPGEGITDYMLALKRLSRHCNYGDQLNENLRDTFVGGLSSKQIKQKLFLIKDLTWTKAQSEALAMEAANRDAQTAATGGEQQTINKVSGKKKFFKPKKMIKTKNPIITVTDAPGNTLNISAHTNRAVVSNATVTDTSPPLVIHVARKTTNIRRGSSTW